MISCQETVGLQNEIGTCWNIAIQTNLFYGHNSDIIQEKLNKNSVDELLNSTVIEQLETFLPPFLLDDNGKLLPRSLDVIKKIVINLKKRFEIKMKQKITKQQNTEEIVCERDFVYYIMDLLHPGKKNKEDISGWGGADRDSFFLTNILDIILLNKLTHIVNYTAENLSKGNRISLNIDKIKNIQLSVHESVGTISITDLTEKKKNHACQFFECGGITKYSNNDTIIEHDWRMFFRILNMLSVNDYDLEKNNSGFTRFSEYNTTPNILPTYRVWQNIEIGPYIVTYDLDLKPSIMYSFSPYFKKEKIIDDKSIIAEGQVTEFNFSYNIECTLKNIKQLIGLHVKHYSLLNMMNNNIKAINKLLDNIDVNIIDKDGRNIIINGIITENKLFVKEALKRINRTTLNYQDKNGYTALLYAVLTKNIYSIKEIMKYKPDVTIKSKSGFDAVSISMSSKIDLNNPVTPEFANIKIAIESNHLDEAKTFLDKLEDINETDNNGMTLLMFTILNPKNNLEIVKEILKKNPDVSIKNIHGYTVLDIANMTHNEEIIELIKSYKPQNVKPQLLRQVSSFEPKVKQIIEDSSYKFKKLELVIFKNDLSSFESIIDKLENINQINDDGQTVLMMVIIFSNNIELLKAVLKRNPDLSITDKTGYTALKLAKLLKKTEMIELLETYKPENVKPVNVKQTHQDNSDEFKQLKIAIYEKDVNRLETLLDMLKDINEIDQNKGWTLLIYLVMISDNIEMLKAILKKNPDLSIKNSDGYTALKLAKVFNKQEMIELLEKYKPENAKPVNVKPANVKLKIANSDINFTVIIDVIQKKDISRLESLLDKIKNINETDADGLTVLMHAVLNNSIEAVKAVLKKNPDLSIKTEYGETALEFAEINNYNEIIRLLKDYSNPINVKPLNVKPVNVKPTSPKINVKPKARHQKCDIIDTLTVPKLNEVFKEINQAAPPSKILKAERLQILKNILNC